MSKIAAVAVILMGVVSLRLPAISQSGTPLSSQ